MKKCFKCTFDRGSVRILEKPFVFDFKENNGQYIKYFCIIIEGNESYYLFNIILETTPDIFYINNREVQSLEKGAREEEIGSHLF